MRKLTTILGILLVAGSFSQAQSQVTKEVKEGAKTVGNKAAEVGSKAKARVTDKVYADKTGPQGQTIYIDKHAKYYWIDDKGHKRYISKGLLKDK